MMHLKLPWGLALVGLISWLSSCRDEEKTQVIAPVTDTIQQQLNRLKDTALTGDLIVRLGDDLLSYQIKFLNEKEQDYSHAGIITEANGEKMVAHIAPDEMVSDGVQYTPLDSFLNPQKNLTCALYRYQLSQPERDSFIAIIQQHKAAGTRFDRFYDLRTDSVLYCSEMISKALHTATQGRFTFRHIPVPPRLVEALYRHFKGVASRETIAQRTVMTIDNLYRIPQCEKIMQLNLKSLPGQ
jgi:hypothetical protein